MTKNLYIFPVLVAAIGAAHLALAGTSPLLDTAVLPRAGSVATPEGLLAWDRIHAVATHPRCLNCHVGADNIPLWGTPALPDRPHGMAVLAGDSRIGAEGLSCKSCHTTSTRPNLIRNAAPHAGMDWQLAPVDFQWTDRTSTEICQQMRDPARNGGRDAAGLVEHILHDADLLGFITWSFDPGPGREPAPGTLQGHLEDMAIWTAAGMPCPAE